MWKKEVKMDSTKENKNDTSHEKYDSKNYKLANNVKEPEEISERDSCASVEHFVIQNTVIGSSNKERVVQVDIENIKKGLKTYDKNKKLKELGLA